jgi:hypothetical protein
VLRTIALAGHSPVAINLNQQNKWAANYGKAVTKL